MFCSRVGFSGTADPMELFPVRTNPRWRRLAILKNSNGHISATGRPIHFMFGYRVGFSGTADLMALFTIRTNPRWRYRHVGKISSGDISATSRPIHFILFLGVFGDGGSNGAISGSNKSKIAASAILKKFKWPYLRNWSSDPLHVWL